ncbi:MAG: YIP1 family protein [Acidobacteria bacterium]|nr:MAG: YIP1 family protein [Acidobacteriota bacterium]
MTIVERVKNICFSPTTEWTVIETESTPPATLVSGYVAPLAAIGAIAGFIGGSIIGRTLPFIGTYRVGIMPGAIVAVFSFVMAIVGVGILSLIINALAPTFGAQKDSRQALKLAAYSYTPAWVAGVLQILPLVGVLVLLAALYGIYLMYLGMPRLMKCPQDRAVGYTALVVVCAIVLNIVVGVASATITGFGMLSSGALTSAVTGGRLSSSDNVQVDKDSPLGKLEELSKKIEQSGKKIDAAEKAGDPAAQTAAAFDALGTLFGGGKRVDPISIDELKPFVPETIAGLPRTRNNVTRNGIGGIMVAQAEATYSNGEKEITFEITDTGGVSGLVALATWTGTQEDKEDEYGYERTRKVGGRLVHEKVSKTGGTNEYGTVVGDRFAVSAKSSKLDLNMLKSVVDSIDLAKLESMKNAGVQK